MATTPPAGTVFATVVDVWLLTAACPSVSPRIEAIICGQYVKMLNPVTSSRITNCPGESDEIALQTER